MCFRDIGIHCVLRMIDPAGSKGELVFPSLKHLEDQLHCHSADCPAFTVSDHMDRSIPNFHLRTLCHSFHKLKHLRIKGKLQIKIMVLCQFPGSVHENGQAQSIPFHCCHTLREFHHIDPIGRRLFNLQFQTVRKSNGNFFQSPIKKETVCHLHFGAVTAAERPEGDGSNVLALSHRHRSILRRKTDPKQGVLPLTNGRTDRKWRLGRGFFLHKLQHLRIVCKGDACAPKVCSEFPTQGQHNGFSLQELTVGCFQHQCRLFLRPDKYGKTRTEHHAQRKQKRQYLLCSLHRSFPPDLGIGH